MLKYPTSLCGTTNLYLQLLAPIAFAKRTENNFFTFRVPKKPQKTILSEIQNGSFFYLLFFQFVGKCLLHSRLQEITGTRSCITFHLTTTVQLNLFNHQLVLQRPHTDGVEKRLVSWHHASMPAASCCPAPFLRRQQRWSCLGN